MRDLWRKWHWYWFLSVLYIPFHHCSILTHVIHRMDNAAVPLIV
jgi:hypothetical protein